MSRLTVALDATPLLGARTGVGEFCAGALEGLAGRDDLEVLAFAVSWRRRGQIAAELPRGVRAVRRPLPARPVHAAWRRGSFPPIELATGAIDVVHGTNFVVPPARRAARVVTVHDLTTVRFPELCERATREFPEFVRRAVGEGAFVHTPSAYVAAEVVEHFGVDPERVRAVAHGVRRAAGARATRPAAAPPGPYLLAMGTVEPRKDLPTLVRAFDMLAGDRPDLYLVVAGPDGWGVESYEDARAACLASGRIRRVGYLTAADRDGFLASAAALCFPSLYEGFGMPVLEAMAVGVPVVATTAGALPEVVGDGGLLVKPHDPVAFAHALAPLLDDPELRARLVDSGSRRAASFTWERAAEGLVALYRDAVAVQEAAGRRRPGRRRRGGPAGPARDAPS